MEDFMRHRRYCKFKKRKTKARSKMNNNDSDDAVTFKVKRFIQDVEKYSILKEKKKARKAKLLENNFTSAANEGVYKNAVFSHPGIKALLSGSTMARLEGDLMSLSKRKGKLDKDIIKLSEETATSDPKETNNKVNDKNKENPSSNELLKSVMYKDDMGDRETISVGSIAELVEIGSNENAQNNRNSDAIEENKEADYGFIGDDGCQNRGETPVADYLRDMSQNASDDIIFDPKPPSVNEGFFDILNKTAENKNSQTFNLFGNSAENNVWKEDYNPKLFEENKKMNVFNSIGIQTLEPIKLPQEYIFKFQPESKEKQDKQVEVNSDEFNVSFKHFNERRSNKPHSQQHYQRRVQNKNNHNYQKTYIQNYFTSPEILKNHRIIQSPILKDFYKPFSKFDSSTSSSIDSVTLKKTLTDVDFSRNQFQKFKHENFYFIDGRAPKFTKYLPEIGFKDEYNMKSNILKKEDLTSDRRYAKLFPNSRFRVNLKFSPHKYC